MREIVGLLVAAEKIDNPQKFVEQLRARETANSTYAADGVAFPHARTNLVDEIVVGMKVEVSNRSLEPLHLRHVEYSTNKISPRQAWQTCFLNCASIEQI